MYDLIRLYVMPIAFAILTVMDWSAGEDFLTACAVWGTAHVLAQLVLSTGRDVYVDWRDHRERKVHGQTEKALGCATRRMDITLEDLNELLERIDRGEEPTPDAPTTEETLGPRLPESRMASSYATFYADNVAYIQIAEVPTPYGTVERV